MTTTPTRILAIALGGLLASTTLAHATSAPSGRYSISGPAGAQTVTDTKTKLTWERSFGSLLSTQGDAKARMRFIGGDPGGLGMAPPDLQGAAHAGQLRRLRPVLLRPVHRSRRFSRHSPGGLLVHDARFERVAFGLVPRQLRERARGRHRPAVQGLVALRPLKGQGGSISRASGEVLVRGACSARGTPRNRRRSARGSSFEFRCDQTAVPSSASWRGSATSPCSPRRCLPAPPLRR